MPPLPPSSLYLDSVLADTQSIPQLYGLVSGPRDNLPVVRGEGHTQHILGMAHESSRGSAPERENLVTF